MCKRFNGFDYICVGSLKISANVVLKFFFLVGYITYIFFNSFLLAIRITQIL
jgi:hypothetical protein